MIREKIKEGSAFAIEVKGALNSNCVRSMQDMVLGILRLQRGGQFTYRKFLHITGNAGKESILLILESAIA